MATGCSAPPPQKTPLVVCEAGKDGCPSEKPSVTKRAPAPADSPTQPADAPVSHPSTPSGTTTPEVKKPDSPTDTPPTDPTPDPTAECRSLQPCCDQLRQAGFTGSADMCDRAVTDANELACHTMHEDNKKPSDDSDFVCH
jgi:hypothetical protein